MSASDEPAPPPTPQPQTPGWPYGSAPAPNDVPWQELRPAPPANGAGGVTSRGKRLRRVVAGTLIAVVVGGGVTGGILAFHFIRGSADNLVSLAPSDTAAYVNVNLDPPASQKLAINGLLAKFPGLAGSQRETTINSWLDEAFRDTGLRHTDVRPWLGSQVSLVLSQAAVTSQTGGLVPLNPLSPGGSSESPPPLAFLVASSDDAKAQAAFDKFRRGSAGAAMTWSTATHAGVTEVIGRAGSGADGGVVWAITSQTAIIGTTTGEVNEVIDTAQGKHGGLSSVSDYTTVNAQLPSDRLSFFYLDLPAVLHSVQGLNAAPGILAQLKGLRGLGGVTQVSDSGVSEQVVEDYDPSKLSADQRSLLSERAHVNDVLAYVPQRAYGFFALTGLQHAVRGIIDEAGGLFGGGLDQMLQGLGITGPNGIVGHLSGDAGVEVDALPDSSVPSGALMLATDSTPAAQAFLGNLASQLCGGTSACDARQETTETYKGVTITSLQLLGGDVPGVQPSWAVSNGLIILASSAAEVRAMLDAHAGAGIAGAPNFQKIARQVSTSNTSMFYLDIRAVVSAIRSILPADMRATFDAKVAPYVNPFRAVGASSQNSSDHATTTLFLLIS